MTAKIIPIEVAMAHRDRFRSHIVTPGYSQRNRMLTTSAPPPVPRSIDDLWPAVPGSQPHPAIWPYPDSEDRE